MRGDFSAWNKDRDRNFRGTLHQQGRVLLDRDWNAQTEVFGEWQETAGRDAFGPGVAAIPAEEPSSFKITQAAKAGPAPDHVEVSVTRGRVWADGLLLELDKDVVRTATYLQPPVQDPAGKVSDLPNGVRDAVILETWLEEVSPFQDPALLLEPALGGVDTTERVQTASRYRLYRMGKDEDGNDETCDSIDLNPDLSKGRLNVNLVKTTSSGGDCPVVDEGGYTGFEHRLYRIEIAQTDRAGNFFKWSQFNGGLVGTGLFKSGKVNIVGNRNAIVNSGLNKFYLEALDFNEALGCWQVVYGAIVTLAADNTLTLPAEPSGDVFLGTAGLAEGKPNRFFRLWNGIEDIADFDQDPPKDLPDLLGIQLKFETGKNYIPADYWTFEVRVATNDFASPEILVDNALPQGIFYHRVPLAEIHWTSSTVTGDDIEDCRQIFQPLTKLRGCCTYRVGDGVHSHGDFKSIQAAIDALPKAGGEVCILPGKYIENIVLKAPHNHNITLKGCGNRSQIVFKTSDPVIRVEYGQNISIKSLAIQAHPEGFGIFLEGVGQKAGDDPGEKEKYLKNIDLSDLTIRAARRSAIRAYVVQFLSLTGSTILIDDKDTLYPGIYLAGDDMLVERNEIRVLVDDAPFTNDFKKLVPARFATGGLQISGGSERVRIIDNLIVNGIGNGITLGSVNLLTKDGGVNPNHDPWGLGSDHAEDICNPDDGHTEDNDVDEDGSQPIAGPPLVDVLIKFNRIYDMGRNGIGVATFFSMGDKVDPNDKDAVRRATVRGMIMISRLVIVENRIELCVNRAPTPIPAKMTHIMGYGGIALAGVEDLVVRDNFIRENGPDFLEPICGIFVLQAEGVEIARNHILNNGIRTAAEPTASTVKNGVRGGIWISRAIRPEKNVSEESVGGVILRTAAGFSGCPAARIHENTVTVELGRALTIFATGEVAVTDNQFTSFGIQPVSLDELIRIITENGKLTESAILQLLALLAGNVLIIDLGKAPALLEQNGASGGFTTLNQPKKVAVSAPAGQPPNQPPGGTASAQAPPRNDFRFAANGNVLFSDNQCHQDLSGPEKSFAGASIVIVSLDDVGFLSNQCDCRLVGDFMITDAIVVGRTTRINDNRFVESVNRVGNQSTLTMIFSAISFGVMNTTTDNIATRCLLVLGALFLNRHNLIELELNGGLTGDIVADHPEDDPKFVCRKRSSNFDSFAGRELPAGLNVRARSFEGLDEVRARQMDEAFKLQNSADHSYNREHARLKDKYGEKDPRTVAMKARIDTNALHTQNLFLEYTGASTALPRVDKAWVVDGFVRTAKGGPASNITVAVYDTDVWQRQFGFSCTDKKGYFSLVVPDAGAQSKAFFMRASKGGKTLPSNTVTVIPQFNTSDRVEIVIGPDNNAEGECVPPAGGSGPASSVPPDCGPAVSTPPRVPRTDMVGAANKGAAESEAVTKPARKAPAKKPAGKAKPARPKKRG